MGLNFDGPGYADIGAELLALEQGATANLEVSDHELPLASTSARTHKHKHTQTSRT